MADNREFHGEGEGSQSGKGGVGSGIQDFVSDLWRKPDGDRLEGKNKTTSDGNDFKGGHLQDLKKDGSFPGDKSDHLPPPEDSKEVEMSNGDVFSMSRTGKFELVDSDGNPVERGERIDEGEISGSATYSMSNGAELHMGEFSNSLRYPNGDVVTWMRNGQLLSSDVGGEKVRYPDEEVKEPKGKVGGNFERAKEMEAQPKMESSELLDPKDWFGNLSVGEKAPQDHQEPAKLGAVSDTSAGTIEEPDFEFSNGDQLEFSPDGGVSWTDKNGNKIQLEGLEKQGGSATGALSRMSNGALFQSGLGSASITYPNGDFLIFTPSGQALDGQINGTEVA